MKCCPLEMGGFFSLQLRVGIRILTSALHVFKRGKLRSPQTLIPADLGGGHAPHVLESNPMALPATNAALKTLPISLLRHLATHAWMGPFMFQLFPMLHLNAIRACFS